MEGAVAQEPILPAVQITSCIDAIDQLHVTKYVLKGVSDSLLALSELSHDYQDVMRMFSDITMHQLQALEQVGVVLEKELRSNNQVGMTPDNEVTA